MMTKNKKSSIIFLAFSLFLFSPLAGEGARVLIENAAKKPSIQDSVDYLQKNVEKVTPVSEKRAVYIFMASLFEQQGMYSEARKNYVQAASLAGSAESAVKGVPNRDSEELVLDAVRCALCAGDYANADSYLNSAVRNSKNQSVLAYVKLYEQWSSLCKAKNEEETKESIAMLKTYSTLDSMKPVRPSVLLTLWHLTGDSQYSQNLKNAFPKSMETAIVKGEIQTLPTPFWYFVPRHGMDLPEVSGGAGGQEAAKISTVSSENAESRSKNASDAKNKGGSAQSSEKIVRQQLGLFRDQGNASRLVEKVKAKGFKASIATEVRPSGTKYYLVVVEENKQGTIGEELRTAGFDCYPLFE